MNHIGMLSGKKNRKILVICPFPQGVAAGQRLKYEQYFQNWRDEGYDVQVSSFMDLKMWNIVYTKGNLSGKISGTIRGMLRTWNTIISIPKFDILYVFMYVTPIGTSLLERLARLLAKKMIYDIEDNVLLQQSNSVNPLTGFLRAKSKFNYLIQNADYVISSSPALNDICLKKNKLKAAKYISSSMDTDQFLPVNLFNNQKKLVIGWTGTFSSKPYLELLEPVFRELKKHREFKLLVIGNFEYTFPGLDLEVIQWTRENEITDLQKIDIGVYPLTVNDWVSGKSGLKAIQYMTIGIPVVATNAGTTPLLINNMENGCLVKTNDEWIKTLITLIDDPALRERIGRNARITAETRFSKAVIKNEYLEIFNNL